MSLSELTITDINTRIFYIKNPDAGSLVTMIPNYMGDDALAFRLMVDNKINLQFMRDKVTARPYGKDEVIECDTANRAIAECFLLMSGVES